MTRPTAEEIRNQYFGIERSASILRYMSRCPVTDRDHDWRYASNAPGWVIGDDCARCQKCQQLGIKPLEAKNEE